MDGSSESSRERAELLRWYEVLLAFATIAIFVLVYFSLGPEPKGVARRLVVEIIPDGILLLASAPVVYLVLRRKGANERAPSPPEIDQLADAIVARFPIQEAATITSPQLVAFYDTYRDVDWASLLASGQNSLDVVVYYFDSWVNQNLDSLRIFLRKPRTRIRLFVSDPELPENLRNIQRLFPEYSDEVIRQKVTNTGQRFADALREAGAHNGRLEFYLVPHLLNYSIQCIDDRFLILSVFEMFRENRIDSPAALLDLSKSSHLAEFWDKELQGLLKISKKVA